MNHMASRYRLSLCLFILTFSWPNICLANTGIPGPMMIYFGSLTLDSTRWLIACMFMCVLIEGAIYKYLLLFNRPVLASLYLNSVSLILGIPLSILAVIDPTWCILPTLASTLSEGFAGRHLPKLLKIRVIRELSRSSFYWKVFVANLITNLIMVAYLYISVWKSNHGINYIFP